MRWLSVSGSKAGKEDEWKHERHRTNWGQTKGWGGGIHYMLKTWFEPGVPMSFLMCSVAPFGIYDLNVIIPMSQISKTISEM